MTKEELLEALEDEQFANRLVHALLGQCTLVCNTRNGMSGRPEYTEIEIKAPDGKTILSDSIHFD